MSISSKTEVEIDKRKEKLHRAVLIQSIAGTAIDGTKLLLTPDVERIAANAKSIADAVVSLLYWDR